MAETKLNLYQKIVKVRTAIGNVFKDSEAGRGSKFSYNYVSGSQILEKIKDEMNAQNLLFIPTLHNKKYEKEGNQFIVEIDLTYTWINADNPEEKLEIPFYAVGQQNDVSKALGTALTYAERYILLKMFNLPTDEDDADAKKPQQQKQQYKQQPKQQVQDKGKLALVKQNANDLADILTANDQKMTQSDVITAYLKGGKIENATNEDLIKLSQSIKAKIADYQKRDQQKEQTQTEEK